MKIHEYQAKAIFDRFGIKIPRGMVAFSAEEALVNCDYIGYPCMVKAQIHAGGRGKGGGVRLVRNREEASVAINALFNRPLVTVQTGTAGIVVRCLLIEECLHIEREFYIGLTVDRQLACPVLMASAEGGMEIEEVAREHPEKILKEWARPGWGLADFQLRRLAGALGLNGELLRPAMALFRAVVNVFRRNDASLVELNPLVLTSAGELVALDGKITFDDNAAFRHPEWEALRDLSNEEPSEVEAARFGLNYIRLTGNVGCMVNGAGLAMATMDIIKHYGGEPANFLDVGGIASAATVANGFRILLSDPHVKAVLVNIFGGIVRCERVAQGIVTAIKDLEIKVSIVIRLEGTNAQEARRLLSDSGLKFTVVTDFADAAQQVVAAAKEVNR
jgi:succinyl-CoA synthetase beta subunit